MKLLVSIALYYSDSMKHKIDNLRKIIDNFINNYPIDVVIYIETNNKKIISIMYDNYFDEIFNNVIKINIHEINFMKHPYDLTKKHRELFVKNIDKYDYFMYIEDDILVPYNSFIEYTKKFEDLYRLDFYPGLIRLENKEDIFYSTDNSMIHYINNQNIIRINDRKYFQIKNSYCACWIAPKKFLKEKINDTKRTFMNSNIHEYIREEMANYLEVTLKMKAIMELDNENKINSNCYIYHLSNNYVGNTHGFGSIPVDKLVVVMNV